MIPRGACPTITTPMQTGDGLLVRIVPQGAMSIDAFCTLCAAAEDHGNGIMEITQRGSLQVRGLTEKSAPVFARILASLDITAETGPPILTSPLLGLDPQEPPLDGAAFVASLRKRLAGHPGLKSLGPKVSVLIDGGGALHLDAIAADVRLVVIDGAGFQLGIAGDAITAIPLGYVPIGKAADRVEEILLQIAGLGPRARATDLAVIPLGAAIAPRDATATGNATGSDSASASDTAAAGGSATASDSASASGNGNVTPGGIAGARNNAKRLPANPLTRHLLTTGQLARGVALPFGHSTAAALRRFARAAADSGATSIRSAPSRSLLVIGLSPSGVHGLCKIAEAEGLVVDASDARRQVVACAGAPACASAQLPTRQLAPEVARAAISLAGTSNMVHLSGCSKGCAHPGPAALTIAGPDSLILNGRASDKAYAVTSAARLIADVTRYCNGLRHA